MAEWPQLARDFGGWGFVIVLAVLAVRALQRGDIVLGREYTTVKEDNTELRAALALRDDTLAKNAAANERLTASVEALTGVVTDVREQLAATAKEGAP